MKKLTAARSNPARSLDQNPLEDGLLFSRKRGRLRPCHARRFRRRASSLMSFFSPSLKRVGRSACTFTSRSPRAAGFPSLGIPNPVSRKSNHRIVPFGPCHCWHGGKKRQGPTKNRQCTQPIHGILPRFAPRLDLYSCEYRLVVLAESMQPHIHSSQQFKTAIHTALLEQSAHVGAHRAKSNL